MNKKGLLLISAAALTLSATGVNTAYGESEVISLDPTRGDSAGYTLKDTGANTTMSVIQYEIDSSTKEIVGQTTKYVDINKTTYTKDNTTGTLTYSWDNDSRELSVTPSNLGIKPTLQPDSVAVYSGKWTGDAIGNEITSTAGYQTGFGYEKGDYETGIDGDYIDNYGYSPVWYGSGYGSNRIPEITGSFIGNDSIEGGGAIWFFTTHNYRINSDFIGNSSFWGGAIDFGASGGESYQNNNIVGDFIGNTAIYSASASSETGVGGAIFYEYSSNDIEANFINNHADKTGGAIHIKDSQIYSIKGNFIDNTAGEKGGAIYNAGNSMCDMESLFIHNSAKEGGAIYNGKKSDNPFNTTSQINSIKADFIANSAVSYETPFFSSSILNNLGSGGAISNYGVINSIEGDFAQNSASYQGGAIFNYGNNANIKYIKGNFYKNTTTGDNEYGYCGGSAITNDNGAKIGTIEGNFVQNIVAGDDAEGAAIDNWGTIDSIIGDFIENEGGYGAAISNIGTIGTIKGNFIGNKAFRSDSYGEGGAISNWGTIDSIEGYFENNSTDNIGGAIALPMIATINSIKADFVNNHAGKDGGAIYAGYDDVHINKLSGNFINNSADGNGGAIYAGYNDVHINKLSGNFINNSADGKGGAIYNTGTEITLVADEKDILFDGNTANGVSNAIHQEVEDFDSAILNFNTGNGRKIVVNDGITGEHSGEYVVSDYLTPDPDDEKTLYNILKINDPAADADNHTGEVQFNETVSGNEVELYDGTLHLAKKDNVLDNLNLTLYGGNYNMVNNAVGVSNLNSLTLNGNTNFVADVDLATETMDRFVTENYTIAEGAKLNVAGMNLISDAKKDETSVLFAQSGLAKHVVSDLDGKTIGNGVENEYQTTAYAPIFKYDVKYTIKDDEQGYFEFAKHHETPSGSGDDSKPSSADFNPAVLASPVATQTAAQANLANTFMYAFEHADAFSILPSADRFAKINSNKHAIASTEYNSNLNYDYELANKAVWVKPYSTFESIDLKNGPKVDTINYGTLIGFDSDFKTLKHGWANAASAYIGYNGSQISYKGVDTSMNGGLLGLTETFYKGNFWTAITATAGAGVAESRTMYGKDDITMLMAGIGSKTGYNFEFNEGKFIIQPRMFLSYSFVNTFDYTNAAGVRIKSDPMHTIQLNPSIRFIGNIKQWQPYASVGMVWNLMNETQATANGVKLPEMHTRPYVEYGIGLQKHWNEKYSAYGQAMVRNGGRTGIALTLGFRMALGKDSTEKVQKEKPIPTAMKTLQTNKTNIVSINTDNEGQRKVIKQLSPTQKAHLMNSTRTAMAGVIK